MKTSLAKIGRARVALALPRHREKLRGLEGEDFDILFETYALAAARVEELLKTHSPHHDLVSGYREICLDIQEDIALILYRLNRQSH
ncbi:hypothetical protein [Ensifer adhaerens]|uniref:hypothetical protein n=1 Tax=Ensifer adhaerens TaxID=106592 RepID=UPI001C4DDE39|nr:hypothetical protein [Ensifer adhaerens]MBW0371384.1 hypothetical protein [Ensifer adhaerens]UCM24401.1 hypothetical protein LDL63_32260 [Ensifer adhaerens]